MSPYRSSRTANSKPTDLRLIDAALDLIEKNGSCRGVNLRQIAAKAKCAHTNAYNYFDSLEDLLWAAVDRALERLIDYTLTELQSPAGKRAPLRHFLETQIAYSLAHPAHYRLFWLEPLSGKPSAQIMKRLEEMRVFWAHLIATDVIANAKTVLTQTDLIWAGQMIHGYFHGEMCKLVGRKTFITTSNDVKERIVSNTLALVTMIGFSKQK